MAAACTLSAHLPALQALLQWALLPTMGLWGQPPSCIGVPAWRGSCMGRSLHGSLCMRGSLHEGPFMGASLHGGSSA